MQGHYDLAAVLVKDSSPQNFAYYLDTHMM